MESDSRQSVGLQRLPAVVAELAPLPLPPPSRQDRGGVPGEVRTGLDIPATPDYEGTFMYTIILYIHIHVYLAVECGGY